MLLVDRDSMPDIADVARRMVALAGNRMFQTVKGNGGTTRLVMLPHESHGYRARQSVLHTQAEMVAWFNKYVKDATNVSSR